MIRAVLVKLGLVAGLGAGLLAPTHTVLADDTARAAREPELNYVLLYNKDSAAMSGRIEDIERAKRHRQAGEPVLWFRDGGREYVVHDRGVLAQILDARRPVSELGEQQSKLGHVQGELGRQQGDLGRQQGLLGARQGTIAVREATLAMRESRDRSDAERAELARQRQALQDQSRALEAQISVLGDKMGVLGDKMEVLGRDMEVLGAKMEAAVRKADDELRVQMKRAIASGLAKRI